MKEITGLEVAELVGCEDVYQLALIMEGYNSKESEVVGTLEDIE